MSAPVPAPAPSQNSNRGNRHRFRRPRRGGGAPGGEARNHAGSQQQDGGVPPRPAAAPSGTDINANSNTTANANTNNSRPPTEPRGHNNRGRGGGRRGGAARGGRRGGTHQPMVNGQRVFGGQLTSIAPAEAEAQTSTLDGEAPVFVPGQPVAPRSRPAPAPRARRMSKSQAPDIATRTHEDITNGQYECAICTNEVLPNSKIWTCKTCWTVLHLSCVKKWSKNDASSHQRPAENGDVPPPRQWRCPGCNLPKEELPTNYTCWCEKEIEPRSIAGLPPHSCGQTCSKARVGHCPHPCELICHAGPCPPCTAMGPSLSCFCGKEISSRRCVDTNYESGWSCAQICGDLLPCGEHTCQRPCHEGVCGACEVLIDSRCYCGRVERPLPCSEREEEEECQQVIRKRAAAVEGEEESTAREEEQIDIWLGSFNCGAECRRIYDCGNPEHFCEKICHPQDLVPAHCPLSPDVVTRCPCGKTPLDKLLSEPRQDCSQPIPHCKEKCLKTLQCGHQCQQLCHEGECRVCMEVTSISCRCGRTTSSTLCHQGTEEQPLCMRVCRATLNCGRHECGEHCCPGEKKAAERQTNKRKHRPLNAAPRPGEEEIEAEHICLKVCGRQLKCGNHFCAELCHKGPCKSCLEAIFEEISCACGRTVLYPPQPCGTEPPECRYDCTRPRPCGHPQVKHHCHGDAESCPKCPFLMEKPCICGKRTLKNQPCWFTEVRCGLPCGKKLKCGIHTCQKTCHRSGQCEDATSPCTQPCGRKKTVCDHTCSDPCHAPYPCKELTPCQAKTFITCPCQHQKQAVKCLASKSSSGNTEKTLECNDECLKLQRNAKLAAALNIDPASHVDDHVPYSSTVLDFYASNTKFAQTYEREFRVFAASEDEKRLRFKPMQAHQRAFIHALAEDYGLDSESQDPEPHRHVVIFKTPRFVSAPLKTIAQCVKPRPPAAAAAASASTPSVTPNKTSQEAFNAFLLSDARFGLTIDEITTKLNSDFKSAGADLDVSFLPSGEVVLKPSLASRHQKLDATLQTLKPIITRKVKASGLAKDVILCAVQSDGNGSDSITRKEFGDSGEVGGWSQVAKGGSARKVEKDKGVGSRSPFTVLGKVKEKVIVEGMGVEDWEREVEGWE
ncbi:hypothetical protein F5884DRAFT_841432 [Xylogone sp. PMI_703]|nr:hypothetical protein F5884DRAFT_841432 [Xylogone sp. PMI_703]